MEHRRVHTENGKNFSGSGRFAFGCQKSWPVSKVQVAFLKGEDDLRTKFTADMESFISVWMKNNIPEDFFPVKGLTSDDARFLYIIAEGKQVNQNEWAYDQIRPTVDKLIELKYVVANGGGNLFVTPEGSDVLLYIETNDPIFHNHLETLLND